MEQLSLLERAVTGKELLKAWFKLLEVCLQFFSTRDASGPKWCVLHCI